MRAKKQNRRGFCLSPDIQGPTPACKILFAVGTTVTRSLESAAKNGQLAPFSGDTNLFIRPGFHFQCVDGLLTNFHLPKSTLLMLVTAFGGYDLVMRAYQAAVQQKYRFFSYGDAMLLVNRPHVRINSTQEKK